MKLSEFKDIARLSVPAAKIQKITDPILEHHINKGVTDICSKGRIFPEEADFNSVEGQSVYLLSTIASDFLEVDKSGLWWKETATSKYELLWPKTKKWLDENVPNWRDQVDDRPLYYYKKGNELVVVPAPSSALSNAFKLNYIAKPPIMSDSEHYSFGGETELVQFEIFDDAVLNYVSWKLLPMLGQRDDYRLAENMYKREAKDKIGAYNRRKDIQSDKRTKYQGRTIR